ncbi:MAG: flagellar biosynthesis protein FlhF [Burkholderiales bacterium]|nr:flagellar biosynthesis protein FlhF [Burkholderiales bacterium]
MNVKRFTGRTSREAMQKVKATFGDDAVVLSTKPCAEGVEILAMADGSVASIERLADETSERLARPVGHAAQPARPAPAQSAAADAVTEQSVNEDVKRLAMSTLSFQDYVRERLLNKRRQAAARQQQEPSFAPSEQHWDAAPAARPAAHAALAKGPAPTLAETLAPASARLSERAADRTADRAPAPRVFDPTEAEPVPAPRMAAPRAAAPQSAQMSAQPAAQPARRPAPAAAPVLREPPVLREELPSQWTAPAEPVREAPARPVLADAPATVAAQPRADEASLAMMSELRAMKGLIEERFGAIAFMEKLQRSPAQAHLAQKLLDCGFSPALIRKLLDGMPADMAASDATAEVMAWAAEVLEHNLPAGDTEPAIEDQGGVFALIGATGVGKTTTTAKLAAAFATKHGAGNLGLITLDAYRVGAHEQLRAYGRILGVPVHTAHDRAALEDLLDLLSAKKMVLIDTAGMAQRDSRTRELLDMLGGRIQKLLVLNAAAQGETIEDVMVSYRAAAAKGVILSKLDEAVKLAPALDAVIRHKVTVMGVANGQRVPEDWHRLSASALVHRALRGGGSPSWRLDPSEVNLVFATPNAPQPMPGAAAARRPAPARV